MTYRLTDTQAIIIRYHVRRIVAVRRRDTLAKLVRLGLVTADPDGKGGLLTDAGMVVSALLVASPDRRTFSTDH
jgi:hypothetical protein